MAQDTLTNLQARINEGKSENKAGKNTKTRVFQLMMDILDTVKGWLSKLNFDIDANGKRITNLPAAGGATEPVRKMDLDYYLSTVFHPGKNLFDKSKAIVGFLVNWNNGDIQPASTTTASDFIPVLPDVDYFLSGSGNINYMAWYTINKVIISGQSDCITYLLRSPSNAAFARVTCSNGALNTTQFEQSSVATYFEDYELQSIYSVKNKSITTEKLSLDFFNKFAFNPELFTLSKNLFDKSKITTGVFVNFDTGVLQNNNGYCGSDFIPVKPSTKYYLSGQGDVNFMAWYTVAKIYISGNVTNPFPLTSPSNAAFARVTCASDNKWNSTQFEEGSLATAYEEYGVKLKYAPSSSSYKNNWSSQKWSAMGDSITNGNSWQPFVRDTLNLLINNFGINGTKISGSDANSMHQDVRINALPLDSKLITVMGGTNDFASDVVLGAETSIDVLTFNGALNVMIGKLITRFPTSRVYLMTNPYGELWPVAGWPNPFTNTLGLTANDYAEATRKACKRWNIPCIDINQDCGWNTVNKAIYMMADGSSYIHPNAGIGGKRVAEIVIGKLKQLDPISLI